MELIITSQLPEKNSVTRPCFTITEPVDDATVILIMFVVLEVPVVAMRIPVCVPEGISISISIPVVVLELPYAVACLVQSPIENATFFFREGVMFTKFPGHTTSLVLLFFQLPDFLASQRPRFNSTLYPLVLSFHAIHQAAAIMITSGMGRHCHELAGLNIPETSVHTAIQADKDGRNGQDIRENIVNSCGAPPLNRCGLLLIGLLFYLSPDVENQPIR
jgi:hypothetical protein